MGDKLDFVALKKALNARDQFLKDNPELEGFQIELDNLLEGVISSEERMNILAKIMNFKREQLGQEIAKLYRNLLIVGKQLKALNDKVNKVVKDDN